MRLFWRAKLDVSTWENVFILLCCHRHSSFLLKTQNKAELPAKSNSRSFFFSFLFCLSSCHSVLLPVSEMELTVDIVNCTSGDFPTSLHRLSSRLYFSYPADGFNYITSCGGGGLLALSIPRTSLFWSNRRTVMSHECIGSHSLKGCKLSRTIYLITYI